ncbi:MAG: hypothetical protein PHS14_18840 [Elusimicrobia bacterium]|nr:hypothetical protein [Elusimicrobiota bacterium]
MTLVIDQTAVRDYLELNSPGSTSKYSDATIGSNIMSAQSFLERVTRRFLIDRPGWTWANTTMLAAQVAIPGFRTFTTTTFGGTVLDVSVPGDGKTGPSAWAIADDINNGTYVALQFRPWRADSDMPWWLALGGQNSWFDQAADNPFDPRNRGGGYAWTSMPNDLVIVGDAGWDSTLPVDSFGGYPSTFLHAVKILSAFYTMRPASILADVAITPSGGVLTYSQLPSEVRGFITSFKLGSQARSM